MNKIPEQRIEEIKKFCEDAVRIWPNAYLSNQALWLITALREARSGAITDCSKVAQSYAERNAQGEESPKMGMVSTYHRIAGENIRDEILDLLKEKK